MNEINMINNNNIQKKKNKISKENEIKKKAQFLQVYQNYDSLKEYYNFYIKNSKIYKPFVKNISLLKNIIKSNSSLEKYIDDFNKNIEDKYCKPSNNDDIFNYLFKNHSFKINKKEKREIKEIKNNLQKIQRLKIQLDDLKKNKNLNEKEIVLNIIEMNEVLLNYRELFLNYSSDLKSFEKMLKICEKEFNNNNQEKCNSDLDPKIIEVICQLMNIYPDIEDNSDLIRILSYKLKLIDDKYGEEIYNYELMKSDLYHLFPSSSNVNSTRSNFCFDEIKEEEGELIHGNNSNDNYIKNIYDKNNFKFNPIDTSKGDISRAICYFDTTYPEYKILNSDNEINLSPLIQLELMIIWNTIDPPLYNEQKKNYQIYKIQNNYNPFTYYPDLLPMIYYNKLPESFKKNFGNNEFEWTKKHFNKRINSFIDNIWDSIKNKLAI